MNPHFRNLHLSNLKPFPGIVNGTSRNKQPFQGRRISRMPKTTKMIGLWPKNEVPISLQIWSLGIIEHAFLGLPRKQVEQGFV